MTIIKKYGLLLFAPLVLITSVQAQNNEEQLVKEAGILFEQGDYLEALPLYSQLLSLNPGDPQYNYLYGATAVYGDSDKKEEAIKFLRYACSKSGIDPDAWYYLGRAYHLNYQFADAIVAFEKYLSLTNPKDRGNKEVELQIEACRNGKNLLSSIKDITVLSKTPGNENSFFRNYDLSDIGGRILVTPDELLSNLDKKNKLVSLIHFPGSGTDIYFSSYGNKGETGKDIYLTKRLPNGKFSDPVKLAGFVNTEFDEDYPYMHPDGKTLYFCSEGHNSMGGYDIFKSTYDATTNTFGFPVNLDFAVNTPDDDLFYIVDSLNNLANFASARNSKLGELDVYKVKVESVSSELTLIKGTFRNEINPSKSIAKISVVDASTNEEIDVFFSDKKGDYLISVPRSGKYKFLVEAEGSSTIHSGIVDIPPAPELTAYLQEMDLLLNLGMEKLIINNKFGQKYEGDITALAQQLLKQKAKLEVNFNQEDDISEVPTVDTVKEKPIEKAYLEVGFNAGYSNAHIIEISEKRALKLHEKADELESYSNSSFALAKVYESEASQLLTEAEKMLQASKDMDDPIQKDRLLFNAGINKFKADRKIRAATNSLLLAETISLKSEDLRESANKAENESDQLKTAIESGNYQLAIDELKKEKERQEGEDVINTRGDEVAQLRETFNDEKTEADRWVKKAMSLREEEATLRRQLRVKELQMEQSKNMDKNVLSKEIDDINEALESVVLQSESAFDKSRELQESATDARYRLELLGDIKEGKVYVTEISSKATYSKAEADNIFNNIAEKTQRADNIDIDESRVNQYLKDNPSWLADALGSDEEMQAFKTLYAVSDSKTETDMEDSPSEDLSLNEEEKLKNNSTSDQVESADENLADNELITSEESKSIIEKETENEISSLDEGNSGLVQKSEESRDIENVDTSVIDTTSEAPSLNDETISNIEDVSPDPDLNNGSDINRNNSETNDLSDQKVNDQATEINDEGRSESPDSGIIQSDIVKNETNIEEEDQTSNLVDEESENYIDEDKRLKIQERLSQRPLLEQGSSPETQIEIEENRIRAANDWISIIDESILDVEKDQDVNSEDNQSQLKDFHRLKAEKLLETDDSRQRIKNLQTMFNEDSVSVELADEDLRDEPLTTELNNQSPAITGEDSYAMEEDEFIINKIDRNYLKKLSAIELSNNDENKIAFDRLKLNLDLLRDTEDRVLRIESGFKKLNEEEIESANAEITLLQNLKSKLLVLIAEDEKMHKGELAFVNRSEAGVEKNKNEEIAKDPNPEEFSEELNSTNENIEIPALIDSSDTVEENTIYDASGKPENRRKVEVISSLMPEYFTSIQILNDQVENTDNKGQINKLKLELLSRVEQEIIEYQTLQSTTEQREADDINKDIRILKEVKGTLITEIGTDEITLNPVAEISTSPAEIDEIEIEHNDNVREIENTIEDPKNKYLALSRLNSETATKIDEKINELIVEMDRVSHENERDLLQLKIQEIEAISADKKQEADRLLAEADEIGNSQMIDDIKNDESIESSAESTVLLEDFMDISSHDPMDSANADIPQISYKSLNANVDLTEIKLKIAANDLKKLQLREKYEDFNSMDESPEKKKLASEILQEMQNVSNNDLEIQDQIMKANAKEIDFYKVNLNGLRDLYQEQDQDAASRDEVIRAMELRASANTKSKEAELIRATLEGTTDAEELDKLRRIALQKEADAIQDMSDASELYSYSTSAKPEQGIPFVFLRNLPDELASTEARENNDLEFATDATDADTIRNNEKNVGLPENEVEDLSEDGVLAREPDINGDNEHPAISTEKTGEGWSLNDRDISILSEMTEKEALQHLELDPRLQLPHLQGNSELSDNEILVRKFNPDPQEMNFIESKEANFNYLVSSARISDLRSQEKEQINLEKDLQRQSTELLKEAERLKDILATAEAGDKPSLNKRISGLISDADVFYERSIIAEVNVQMIRDFIEKEESERLAVIKSVDAADYVELQLIESRAANTEIALSSDIPSFITSKEDAGVDSGFLISEETLSLNDDPDEKSALLKEQSAEEPKVITATSTKTPIPITETIEPLRLESSIANKKRIIEKDIDFALPLTESLFSFTKESIYTKENPIPIDAPMPTGLIFQVQVGAFRNAIPQDLFKDFAPIMGDRLPNGITRYRVGLFLEFKTAAAVRDEVRKMQYKDAFVVAYYNGQRLSISEAREILKEALAKEGSSEQSRTDIAINESTPSTEIRDTMDVSNIDKREITENTIELSSEIKVSALENANLEETGELQEFIIDEARAEYYDDPTAAKADQVEVTPGLFYTVQVGVYSKPVSLDKLFNINPLNSELTASGYIRYTTGKFDDLTLASAKKAGVIDLGVTDAFVTAYYNGKRISITEAADLLKEKGEGVLSSRQKMEDTITPLHDQTKISYYVLLGQFEGEVPQDFAIAILSITEIEILKSIENGKAIYYTKEFTSREEAENILESLKNKGISDANLIKLTNGELISD